MPYSYTWYTIDLPSNTSSFSEFLVLIVLKLYRSPSRAIPEYYPNLRSREKCRNLESSGKRRIDKRIDDFARQNPLPHLPLTCGATKPPNILAKITTTTKPTRKGIEKNGKHLGYFTIPSPARGGGSVHNASSQKTDEKPTTNPRVPLSMSGQNFQPSHPGDERGGDRQAETKEECVCVQACGVCDQRQREDENACTHARTHVSTTVCSPNNCPTRSCPHFSSINLRHQSAAIHYLSSTTTEFGPRSRSLLF